MARVEEYAADVQKLRGAGATDEQIIKYLRYKSQRRRPVPGAGMAPPVPRHLPGQVTEQVQKTGNRLLDTLEAFDRPRAVVAGAIKGAQEGVPIGETLWAGRPAVAGAKGEAKETGRELLFTPEQREAHPVGTIAGGIAADIAMDPLTYTPGVVLSAPYRAVKGIRKALKVSELRPATGGRLFNVLTGDEKQAHELFNSYRRLVRGQQYQVVRDAKQMAKDVDALSASSGISRAEITDAIESGRKHPGRVGELENKLQRRMREILEIEQDLGVDVGDLGETYLAHVLTPRGRKQVELDAFRKKPAAYLADFISLRPKTTHASAAMRKLEGTVKEINEKRGMRFFHNDPVLMSAVREMRHAQVKGGVDFIRRASDELGVALDGAPEGWRELKNVPKALKGRAFDPEVATLIERQYKSLSRPEEVAKFLQMFDAAQGWWKSWALFTRPAYHARNLAGNFWNSYLGGMDNPIRGAAAHKDATVFLIMRRTQQFSGEIAGKPATEFYEKARDLGVFGRGQFTADIARAVGTELEPTRFSPTALISRESPAIRAGMAVGSTMEDTQRVALFADGLRRGMSYEDAAQNVHKHLFDYEDLAPFEREVMKRVMPFYTWTRKNIPLQVQAILKQPDKIQKVNIIRQNIQSDLQLPPPERVDEWVKDAGPIYFDKEGEEYRALTMMNYHPLMDVGRAVEPGEFLNMVSPFIKAAGEWLGDYDTFRNRIIEQYPGQKTDFLGIRMPIHLAHLLRNLVLVNEIDRANPANIFGERKYDPETGEFKATRAYGGRGALREQRTDLPGGPRWLQYMLGIRPYAVDPERALTRVTGGKAHRISPEVPSPAHRPAQFEGDINEILRLMRSASWAGREDTMRELESLLDKYGQAED